MEKEYGIFNYTSYNPVSFAGESKESKEKIKKPSLN